MRQIVSRLALAAFLVAAIAGVIAVLLPGRRPLLVDVLPLVLCALALLALVRVALLVSRERPQLFDAALGERPPRTEAIAELAGLERSLTLSEAATFDLHFRVRPILREIAAHRLATRHGVDLDADSERARALLGEDAWELVRANRERPPAAFAPGMPTAELRRVVERLEAL